MRKILIASLACTADAFSLPAVTTPATNARRVSAVCMASGNSGVSFGELDGSEVRIGIIRSRWNQPIIDSLVSGAKEALTELGVTEENIVETEVPGAFELPLACRYLALSGTVDAILPVGVLIKGDTTHYEVISESVAEGLMQVGLSTGVPVLFGVLTALNEGQAVARSTGDNNHGEQWGKAAVEMALLRKSAIGTKGGKKNFLGFGEDSATGSDKPPAKKIGF